MRLAEFLCLDGNEVSNGVRILTYLRRGLAGPSITIPLEHTCAADTPESCTNCLGVGCEYCDDYFDLYTETYGEIVEPTVDNSCLACYCATLDEAQYRSPELDTAPWYINGRPETGEFLGFHATDITLDSPLYRNVIGKANGGGVVTQQQVRHRVVAVEGLLYATSPRGMSYGERWLYDVLQGARCSSDGELVVLPSCWPSGSTEDEHDDAFRTLKQVGLIEGPEFDRPIEKECLIQSVSFQLAAGVPYLHAPAEQIMDLGIEAASECATYTTPEWGGDAAMIIRIGYGPTDTGTGSARLTFRALADEEDCELYTASACLEFNVTSIQRDEHLLIDAVNRRILLYNPASKQYESGWSRLSFQGLFSWPIIEACTTVCVCVERTSDVAEYPTATIDVYRREL